MKRFFAALALSFVAALAVPQERAYAYYSSEAVDLLRDAVLTLKGAYIMLPPKPILADVEEIHWSPAGTKLIAVTRSQESEIEAALQDLTKPVIPSGERYLALVDPERSSFKWISGIKRPFAQLDIEWPASGGFCIVSGVTPPDEKETSYRDTYLIDIGAGAARPLTVEPGDDVYLTPYIKGQTVMQIVSYLSENEAPTYFLDAKGNIVANPPGLDEARAKGWMFSYWSETLGLVLGNRNRDFAVLLPSGIVQAVDRQSIIDDARLTRQRPVDEPPLQVTTKRARQAREAWLVARPDAGVQPAALICALIEQIALSPKLDAVAYTSQRMLWVRRMVTMDGEEAVLLREQVYRAEMMKKAKMIGTALMIYSTDYDDCFPTGNPVEALMPYAKNRDLFTGYIFTFKPGQAWTDIENITETEIGHFRLAGGRVVTYADSSVRWVPDK